MGKEGAGVRIRIDYERNSLNLGNGDLYSPLLHANTGLLAFEAVRVGIEKANDLLGSSVH